MTHPGPIFVDTNVVIYSRSDDPRWGLARQVLKLCADRSGWFFTDSEVLQEILHHLRRVGASAATGGTVRDLAGLLLGDVESVGLIDVVRAGGLGTRHPSVSTRDLVHLAVMERRGSTRIVSADSDFDAITGITRLDPFAVEAWAGMVERT